MTMLRKNNNAAITEKKAPPKINEINTAIAPPTRDEITIPRFINIFSPHTRLSNIDTKLTLMEG